MADTDPNNPLSRATPRRSILTGGAAAAAGLAASGLGTPLVARAQETHSWRVQTHFPAGSPAVETMNRFIDDVATMSNGQLTIEPYTSSSLVKITETFNAARTGILDADMSWPGYAIGVDPAFQFFGDVNGGYLDPELPQHWLDYGGGRALADELFHPYNMHLVGFWNTVPESLVSTVPLPDYASLEGFRLRSPLGLQGDVLRAVGAEPVVMDFGEVFTALDTGIVDGADAAELRVNDSLGLYEVAKHTTYPGWHAMPWVHLAVNKEKWDALSPELQRVVDVALRKAQHERWVQDQVIHPILARELEEQGVTVYTWPDAEIDKFRQTARPVWEEYAGQTPESKKIYDSHVEFMKKTGVFPS